ncbi:unnamed protein product [Oppiella nova]|uniref:Uncharacterized protein n=1 Tax=Oppiella nova TaxID=334625 RepID=A0A7R9MIA8_9ACAR|nr:unnamed protein product [Oppiella nova]CAG2177477.1 unnamed protein product [Oppiella nova]
MTSLPTMRAPTCARPTTAWAVGSANWSSSKCTWAPTSPTSLGPKR